MSAIGDAEKLYKRLTGAEMPPEVQKDFLSIKAELGLSDNDSMFVVFVALGYYTQLYRGILADIEQIKEQISVVNIGLKSDYEKYKDEIPAIHKLAAKAVLPEMIANHQMALDAHGKQILEGFIQQERIDIYAAAKKVIKKVAGEIQQSANQAMEVKTRMLIAVIAVVVVLVLGVGLWGGYKIGTTDIQHVGDQSR